jgi:hypothetical protein
MCSVLPAARTPGKVVTIFSASEFFFEGIRFDPGTYEIRKVPEKAKSSESEPPF